MKKVNFNNYADKRPLSHSSKYLRNGIIVFENEIDEMFALDLEKMESISLELNNVLVGGLIYEDHWQVVITAKHDTMLFSFGKDSNESKKEARKLYKEISNIWIEFK